MMQKKCNYLSQKLHKAKDNLTDMEKKVEQLMQHLEENVLKQKVLEQEKDQAGTHFIMQEKNMQAKICNLQEEKNELKVSVETPERVPSRGPKAWPRWVLSDCRRAWERRRRSSRSLWRSSP